jgi:molybdopterin molybdotransferase
MIEHINRLDDEYIEVYKPVSPGENIMFAGDDMKKGETAIKRGRIISPLDIGALAATGKTRIEVYKRLVFYIISTGDEIIEPSRNTDYGMVRDINGYTLQALVRKSGGEVIKRTIVRDDYGLLREELEKASELADIVLISGGSSVGTRDFTPDIINSFGNRGVFVHGIAIKPGKPTIVGKVKNKAVFGLPGHPVSAVIVYKVIVEHLINHLYGINRQVQSIKAVISTNVHSSPGSRTYRMVSLNTKNGVQYADVIYGKSGMITLLSKACGYIVIDENEEGLNRGKEVEVYLL